MTQVDAKDCHAGASGHVMERNPIGVSDDAHLRDNIRHFAAFLVSTCLVGRWLISFTADNIIFDFTWRITLRIFEGSLDGRYIANT